MNGDKIPKEFKIHSWSKEIGDWAKNSLRWRKPVEKSEIPVLRKLISPKNSKIL
jgi:hypothetical protein